MGHKAKDKGLKRAPQRRLRYPSATTTRTQSASVLRSLYRALVSTVRPTKAKQRTTAHKHAKTKRAPVHRAARPHHVPSVRHMSTPVSTIQIARRHWDEVCPQQQPQNEHVASLNLRHTALLIPAKWATRQRTRASNGHRRQGSATPPLPPPARKALLSCVRSTVRLCQLPGQASQQQTTAHKHAKTKRAAVHRAARPHHVPSVRHMSTPVSTTATTPITRMTFL